MEKIIIDDCLEKEKLYSPRYIYIKDLYSLNDKNLDIYDKNSYQKYSDNFCDSSTALNSILDMGKKFLNICKLNNIKDITENNISCHKKAIHKLTSEWLMDNPYPYEYLILKNNQNFILEFINDCVKCYCIYEIYKWLIKVRKEKEVISTAPQISKTFQKLHKSLEFINFENLIKFKYPITESPNEIILFKNKNKERLKEYGLIKNQIFTYEKAEDYCRFIFEEIKSYIYMNMVHNSSHYENPFFQQRDFYDPDTQLESIIQETTCIMDTAYTRLYYLLCYNLLNEGTVICHNPNCNREFIPKNSEQKFCNLRECQAYRNRRKSKSSYERKIKEKG